MKTIFRGCKQFETFSPGPQWTWKKSRCFISRCSSGLGRSHLCMYVPCIVCLLAERYAEDSKQLTEAVKSLPQDFNRATFGRLGRRASRAGGEGANAAKCKRQQSMCRREGAGGATDSCWAPCALATTFFFVHRYNSTC